MPFWSPLVVVYRFGHPYGGGIPFRSLRVIMCRFGRLKRWLRRDQRGAALAIDDSIIDTMRYV